MLQHDPLLAELGLAPLWVSRERVLVPAAVAPAERTPAAQSQAGVAAAEPSTERAVQALRDAQFEGAPSELKPSPKRSDAAPADEIPLDAYDASDDFAGYESVASERLDFVPPADFDAPAPPGVATLDFGALRERVASCTACGLCEKRTQTVFGVGDEAADWMIIGEAPGENEDRLGEPFVGQAGKLLDNMLRAVMLNRTQNVYIANVIKCRPPGNRNPLPAEVAHCEPYLKRQVALVRPKLILALGKFAAQTLLKSDASVSSMRGRVHHYEGVPVIVSYHPAYLLRSLPEKSKAWADLCLAQATFLKAAT